MRRTWWGRAFSAAMAVWLALALSEPAFLHSCPIHGSATHALAGGMTHHAMAHGAERTGTSPTDGPDSPQPASHHGCTCLGHCCGAAPAGLPARVAALPLPLPARVRVAPAASTVVPVAAEYLHPFPNGPPAAA